jgi:hypothetical protein
LQKIFEEGEKKPLFLRHLSRMNLKNNFRRMDGIFNQYE